MTRNKISKLFTNIKDTVVEATKLLVYEYVQEI